MNHILVSMNANCLLGELLWIGTNTHFNHQSDGQFKSIGSYYLWLSTTNHPIVRNLSYQTGLKALEQAGEEAPNPSPDTLARLKEAIYIVLKQYQQYENFLDYGLVTSTDFTSPSWYQSLLNECKAEFK